MDHVIFICNILFFAGIGIVGFVIPNNIIAYFGTSPHADMRNEIRTVYGGMCTALALGGIVALVASNYFGLITAMYALVLLSNAAGRLIGRVIEPSSTRLMGFLVVELLLGSGALYLALKG